jgi:uncharacterized protein
MATSSAPQQIDPKLLDILRCPVAVHYTDKGDDPGKLELVRDYWLYSPDSGHKYPIIDGIPKMLVEEGARWKDTDIDDLPVPPPNDPVSTVAEEALTPEMQTLVDDLQSKANGLRGEIANQLSGTAQDIRQQAQDGSTDAAKNKANEIADGLDEAANFLKNGTLTGPKQATRGVPWALLTTMFILGVVLGAILRSNNKGE